MAVIFRLVTSLSRCLCCISSVFLVIQPINWCSSVSLYCLLNIAEVKSFALLKSSGGGQFYRRRLRLLTEYRILKYNADCRVDWY